MNAIYKFWDQASRFKRIAVVASICLVVILTSAAVSLAILISQDNNMSVRDVAITNLTDTAFTVSWVSDVEYIGRIIYQEGDSAWLPVFAQLGKPIAYDDRDVKLDSEGRYVQVEGGAKPRFTHHVTVKNLKPATTYTFRVAGAINGYQSLFNTIQTKELISDIKTPEPAYGKVEGFAVDDSIIILTKRAFDETNNSMISVPIANNSTYSIDLNGLGIKDVKATELTAIFRNKTDLVASFDYTDPGFKPFESIKLEHEVPQSSSSGIVRSVFAAENCAVICNNGETFADNPQTFNNCTDWENEACAPRGGVKERRSATPSSGNNSGNSTSDGANSGGNNTSGTQTISQLLCSANNITCTDGASVTCGSHACVDSPGPINTVVGCIDDSGKKTCVYRGDRDCVTQATLSGCGGIVLEEDTYLRRQRSEAARQENAAQTRTTSTTEDSPEQSPASADILNQTCTTVGDVLNNTAVPTCPPPVNAEPITESQCIDNRGGNNGVVFCSLPDDRYGAYCAPGGTQKVNNNNGTLRCLNLQTDVPVKVESSNTNQVYGVFDANATCQPTLIGSSITPQWAAYSDLESCEQAQIDENNTYCSEQTFYEYSPSATSLVCIEYSGCSTIRGLTNAQEVITSLRRLGKYTSDRARIFTTRQDCEADASVYRNRSSSRILDSILAESPASTEAILGADTVKLEASESGRYVFFRDGQRIADKDVVVRGDSVELKLFTDTNGNGRKDSGEEYIQDLTGITLSKEAVVETYDLSSGWNLIHLPLFDTRQQGAVESASQLLEYWARQDAEVIHVAKYEGGQFRMVTRRESGNVYSQDFDLTPGDGLFVYNVGEQQEVTFSGRKPEGAFPVALSNGWNLVGFTAPGLNYNSESLLGRMRQQEFTPSTISQFENGLYQSVVYQDETLFGNNFNIVENRGYFVKLEAGGGKTFTP